VAHARRLAFRVGIAALSLGAHVDLLERVVPETRGIRL
jgi:hypothetical protein